MKFDLQTRRVLEENFHLFIYLNLDILTFCVSYCILKIKNICDSLKIAITIAMLAEFFP